VESIHHRYNLIKAIRGEGCGINFFTVLRTSILVRPKRLLKDMQMLLARIKMLQTETSIYYNGYAGKAHHDQDGAIACACLEVMTIIYICEEISLFKVQKENGALA
jgi:hypothetical protein